MKPQVVIVLSLFVGSYVAAWDHSVIGIIALLVASCALYRSFGLAKA
jgi:NhaP-type Na+/H+ or K+/H+ antiporter